MEYLPPFVAHGTHRMTPEEMKAYGADYCRLLEALRDGRIDLEQIRGAGRINADLDTVIRG
jgi:glutathione-regulated potassium-efflux system ancillary protein KefG